MKYFHGILTTLSDIPVDNETHREHIAVFYEHILEKSTSLVYPDDQEENEDEGDEVESPRRNSGKGKAKAMSGVSDAVKRITVGSKTKAKEAERFDEKLHYRGDVKVRVVT